MGNWASSPWSRSYEAIKETHDEAYHCIEAAISLEEQEKPQEAIEKYKEGILLIDKALDIQVMRPDNPDFTWERACGMIQKMKKTRAEVLTRINSITSSPGFVPREAPLANQNVTYQDDDVPRTYNDLADALNTLDVESIDDTNVEIIYSYDNVQLYFISPDGSVTQSSEPQTLNIAILPGNERSQRIFLQIGEWIYPLVPGVSPCFRTDYGAFILPDVHADTPGASVGLILPSEADSSVYELLENILHGVISQDAGLALHPHKRARRAIFTRPEPPGGFSQSISNGLLTGAYYISQGLITGAQKASLLINYGTPKVIGNLTPASEVTMLPPTLTRGFEIASSATGTAAQFTGYIADQVGYATQALGRYLAPHIQQQGTKLLTSGFQMSEEEASSKLNGILTVAAGAVESFSTVYHGLETSAGILASNLSNNTVKIVEHKYGVPAGHLASNTFNTMGNVLNIGGNAKFFTAKGITKFAAKETGKAIVEDMRFGGHVSGQAFLYPDLQTMQIGAPSLLGKVGRNVAGANVIEKK